MRQHSASSGRKGEKLEESTLGTEKQLIRIADTLEKIVEKLDKIEKAIFSIG
jgi:hypothetical protein